jgi:O-antigen/teichoic acid export membrane protein
MTFHFAANQRTVQLRIQRLLSSRSARHAAMIFSSQVAANVLSVLTVSLVARRLGPTDFGALGTYNSLLIALVMLTDFGLGTTLLKLVSQRVVTDPRAAAGTMRIIAKVEVLAGLLLLTLGFAFADQFHSMLGIGTNSELVRWAFVAGAFATTGAFVIPALSAYHRLTASAIVTLSGPIIRLVSILILLARGPIEVGQLIDVYTWTLLAVLVIGVVLVPWKRIAPSLNALEKKSLRQEIGRFSGWTSLSVTAAAITARADVLMLARWKGAASVGFFVAAQQLAIVVSIATAALNTAVVASRSSSGASLTRSVVRQTFRRYLLASMALLAVLPLGGVLCEIIFGSAFREAVRLFQLLYVAGILAMLAGAFSSTLLAEGSVRSVATVNWSQAVVGVLLNSVLIPKWGAVGASSTACVTALCGLCWLYWIVRKRMPSDNVAGLTVQENRTSR